MKPFVLVLNLLCAGDAATTHVALSRGATEWVLPTQSPWMSTALIAGEAGGLSGALVWLDRRQHPKAARALAIAAIGIRAAVIANNLHQLRK